MGGYWYRIAVQCQRNEKMITRLVRLVN